MAQRFVDLGPALDAVPPHAVALPVFTPPTGARRRVRKNRDQEKSNQKAGDIDHVPGLSCLSQSFNVASGRQRQILVNRGFTGCAWLWSKVGPSLFQCVQRLLCCGFLLLFHRVALSIAASSRARNIGRKRRTHLPQSLQVRLASDA